MRATITNYEEFAGNSMSTYVPWSENRFAPLAERHEQLLRTSQAMWQLLKARLDFSDDELRHSLSRIERSAGLTMAREGVESQLLDCRVCRYPVQRVAKCCLYCGTAPQAKTSAAYTD